MFFSFRFLINIEECLIILSGFLLRALSARSHFYHKQIKSNLTEKERAQKFANATRRISGERERERERGVIHLNDKGTLGEDAFFFLSGERECFFL